MKLSYSQTYIEVNIIQPIKLQVHAGNDTIILPGSQAVLGGKPSVTGGKSDYTYLWKPSISLNNYTIANPIANPNKTTLYSLIVTDANGCTDSSGVKVTIKGYTLSGILSYNNLTSTPINNTEINLVGIEGIKIDNVITNASGNFVFQNVANGSYRIEPNIIKPWGGGNPLDALIDNRSYIGTYVFNDLLYKKAADVNKDKKINPTDALMINRRYVGTTTSFLSGNWLFQNDTISIQGNDINHDIKADCYGDVNGSYVPNLSKQALINMASEDILTITKGETFELPIKLTSNFRLAAIGLKLKVSNSNLQIIDLYSNIDGLVYKILPDGVNIAWAAEKEGLFFKAGDDLVVLKLKYAGNTGDLIISPLQMESESILIDDNAEEINKEILTTPNLAVGNIINNTSILHNCFPNPFNQLTVISYHLPENSFVNIKVFDMLGNNIKTLINSTEEKGSNRIEFDASGFEAGIYYYRINANGRIAIGKMVLMN